MSSETRRGTLIVHPTAMTVIAVIAWMLRSGVAAQELRPAPDAPGGQVMAGTVRQSVQIAGIRSYAPGGWSVAGTRVANPTDRAIQVVSLVFSAKDHNWQFGRELWVPPRSIRSAWIPFRVDGVPSRSEKHLAMRHLLLDRSGEQESDVLLSAADGGQMDEILLPLSHERPRTGVIADPGDELALDAVIAMRINRGLSRHLVVLHDEFLTSADCVLEGLDELVLMSDRPARDLLAMAALRHWLISGGRLWIMLDQVHEMTVAMILEDACELQVIDRVGLTEGHLRPRTAGSLSAAGQSLQFDEPLELVRVLAPAADVMHTIDDWPAALFLRHGRGTVLVTTLPGAGWLRPGTPDDFSASHPQQAVSFVATPALEDVAFRFSGRKAEPALAAEAFRNSVSEQIGYRIISRGTMLLTLSGFCLGWGIAGVWLARQGRLEHISWAGPLLSVATVVVLAVMEYSHQGAIPNTVATSQLIEVAPGSSSVEMSGLLGIYQRDGSARECGATAGGYFLPENGDEGGEVQRMVWTDLDSWHLEQGALHTSLMLAPFRYSGSLSRPVIAEATYGPGGLQGTVTPGVFQNPGDATIAMPWGTGVAVAISPAGTFVAGKREIIAPGMFIESNLLSDEQRRRQAIYQSLLPTPVRRDFPGQPMLLTWADAMDVGWRLPAAAQQRGSALLAIPLRFTRPEAGTRVSIPGPMIRYESAGHSSAFDNKSRQWGKLAYARTTSLRFQIPEHLLPVRIDQADLTVDIDGPSRPLEITGGAAPDAAVLIRFDSPVGPVRFRTTDAALLRPDAEGGLIFGVNVGDALQSISTPGPAGGRAAESFWNIRRIELEVSGEVLEVRGSPAGR